MTTSATVNYRVRSEVKPALHVVLHNDKRPYLAHSTLNVEPDGNPQVSRKCIESCTLVGYSLES